MVYNAFSVVSAAQGKLFHFPSGNMIITPQAISVKPARLIVMFFQYYLDIPGLECVSKREIRKFEWILRQFKE